MKYGYLQRGIAVAEIGKTFNEAPSKLAYFHAVWLRRERKKNKMNFYEDIGAPFSHSIYDIHKYIVHMESRSKHDSKRWTG